MTDTAAYLARKDESHLRTLLSPDSLPNLGRIVAVGKFHPGDYGSYGGFDIAVATTGALGVFSTHLAYYNDEDGRWAASCGHYDLTMAAAAAALEAQR